MKKLVAFTALATLGLMIFDVDPRYLLKMLQVHAAEDLAKAGASGLKGIGGGLAAGLGALRRRRWYWTNWWRRC